MGTSQEKTLSGKYWPQYIKLSDYRELFSKHFETLEEKVKRPDFGKEFLTPKIRQELSSYSEEDLLTNQVLFVLKPKNIKRGY